MKIAVSGKGGAGKTTVAAGLIKILVEKKKSVVALDCDPDISLGLALDFPQYAKAQPICEMKELIAERTESDPQKPQVLFKINPKVDDIPERFCPQDKGLRLIVMGKVNKPQGGCLCPENTFVRSLIGHLVLRKDEVVVLDMAAGSEHLGRATAKGVDIFLIVVEPSRMSVQTGWHIQELAKGLGIQKAFFVGNKIKGASDINFVKDSFGSDLIGNISFSKTLEESRGRFVFDDNSRKEFESIYERISNEDAT
jgi:CO dehydrogenase maturation factor